MENCWSRAWGIFAMTPVGLDALRTHFRRFLRIRDPEGKVLYFRYYGSSRAAGVLGFVQRVGSDTVFWARITILDAGGERQVVVLGGDEAFHRAEPFPIPDEAATDPRPGLCDRPVSNRPEHIQAVRNRSSWRDSSRGRIAQCEGVFSRANGTARRAAHIKWREYGLHRAKAGGITAEREVLLWITLMILLGSDFDDDFQLPWGSSRRLAMSPLRTRLLIGWTRGFTRRRWCISTA